MAIAYAGLPTMVLPRQGVTLLMTLAVPLLVGNWALKERSRPLGFVALGCAALVAVLGFVLLAEPAHTGLGRLPTGSNAWINLLFLRPLILSLCFTPAVVFWVFLVHSLGQRRWARAALLAGAAVALSSVAATIFILLERKRALYLGAVTYSLEGWYLIGFVGIFGVGLFLAFVQAIRFLGRRYAQIRKRLKGVAKTATPETV